MSAIYDKIGAGYDSTRCADPALLKQFTNLLEIRDGNTYLDIGCGTGNYTIELAKLGGTWSAFDHSELMIAEAKKKSSALHWDVCDVKQTPYSSNHFNAALCSLAIHHFSDLDIAFGEIARILIPTGKLVLLTATPEQMNSYWLHHYFPIMMERAMEQMPSMETIKNALANHKLKLAQTKLFSITPELQDLFLYSGKQRPEIYLSESVRAGISSFRNFCTDRELEPGLALLKTDIESGKIHEIIKSYEKDLGDYCFLVAVKLGVR